MTPSSETGSWDAKLILGLLDRNMMDITAALSAGANVNGNALYACSPIVAATYMGNLRVVKHLLIDHKADPDTPVPRDWQPTNTTVVPLLTRGERALHFAASRGCLETIRVLLQARADPNATDARGRTPLLVACAHPNDRVGTVRLLLEAGADPTRADENGFSTLHVTAMYGRLEMIDILHSNAPDALNQCTARGETPLYLACSCGFENIVSRLLSMGAKQPMPFSKRGSCPLAVAVEEGHAETVRVIIEKGLEAIGGEIPLIELMYSAIRDGQARTLKFLIEEFVEAKQTGPPLLLLHHASGFDCQAGVDVLLRAGADETTPDSDGHLARDAIGRYVDPEKRKLDRGIEVAIGRMLGQGSAYRARSWLWPAGNAVAGGDGDGDGDGYGDGDGDDDKSSSRPARRGPLGVQVVVFRQKGRIGGIGRVVGRVVGRYSEKV